ncbi:IclR family transcriptional regulator [Halomarina oriensis]|uniref:Helix-turn-helix domain-containing protein n=1 Tax=Halomarina oriensis TaxID=671145 RepID=A0A6B0GHR3_9EURY|nr:IclR family transcriptional regulator [Halomarina oriensis]MWG33457.1 helix-turn-helix domain-containing protein [Halomarina oriensis]
MGKQARHAVKSVENAFEILDALKELDGAGVSELSEHLDFPKSTIHNYLSTLLQEEYVVKDGSTYHVGIRFLEYGAFARIQMDIYDIAKPEVDTLAETTGELANLMVEQHGRGSYLHRARGDRAVQVEAHVGTRVPLHGTALGKAILAHLPEERVDEIVEMHGLQAYTPKTVTDRAELDEDLAEIREAGVAFDDEERLPGLRCVAAPILSNNGRVLGAISVSGPSNRIRDERFTETLPNRVLETVNVIELNVTYS